MMNCGGKVMKRLLILLILLFLVGLGACAKVNKMPADLLRIAVSAYPTSLVPTRLDGNEAKLVQAQIYETLFIQTDSLYQPVLAQALPVWDADGMRCVITIAQNISFHDGRILKAQDAVYSINHLIDAKTSALTVSIATVTLIDDTSFAIALKYPDGELLSKLSNPMFAIIPTDSDADAKLETSPLGTGPYKYVSSDKNSLVTLTRFDTYHGEKALIKDVEFVVYADINNALTALRDKDVNLVANVPPSAKPTVESIKGLQWIKGESTATAYLGIRNQSMMNTALESQGFRAAIMSSINRTTFAQGLGSLPMTNLFGPGVFGNPSPSANFLNGAAIESYKDSTITIVSPKLPIDFDVTAQVAAQLKQAGFTKVVIETLDAKEFLQRTSADQGFDLMIFVWEYDVADGGDFVDSFFGTDSVNRLRFQNSDLDNSLLVVNRSYDSVLRKTELSKIENLLLNAGTILPLSKTVVYAATAQNLLNVAISPEGLLDITQISIAEKP
jgi:peptide/nickel transport system substrate-binding protein